MKSFEKWLFIFCLFAACGVATWFLATRLEVSFEVALLIAMTTGYLLISVCLEWFRYRLRQRARKMTTEEREAISEFDPEFRYSIPAQGAASPRITTLIGVVAVNGPVIALMVGPLALLRYVFDSQDPLLSALSLALGFVLAWTWWSVGITVWRSWAITRRGMPPGEVQWRGEKASLLWPKNHFFEKTELGSLLSKRRSQ